MALAGRVQIDLRQLFVYGQNLTFDSNVLVVLLGRPISFLSATIWVASDLR